MAYYAKDNCVSSGDQSGCSNDYDVSDIKQVVDLWVNNYTIQKDLDNDSFGYKSRLVRLEDLIDNMGYIYHEGATSIWYTKSENTPNFISNDNYTYWTMSSDNYFMWSVGAHQGDEDLPKNFISNVGVAVRPVITIKKSALN